MQYFFVFFQLDEYDLFRMIMRNWYDNLSKFFKLESFR